MKSVLIVEDNPSSMRLAQDVLTREGYQVFTARNADEGILLARDHMPAVIVMDIQLPGTDGLTATRLLRADEKTHPIPIVAVSAHAMDDDRTKILDSGCDEFLQKPIQYQEFVRIIADLAGDGRTHTDRSM